MIATEERTPGQSPAQPDQKNVQIFQIYYDAPTRALVDPGFTPFDNTSNQRPEWAEYWCFRSIWQQHRSSMAPGDFLGIFSPRFGQKMGLSAKEVHDAVQASDKSVISFSPHLHHTALFNNIFAQGDRWQPGLTRVMTATLTHLGLNFDCNATLGTFKNTIFSNYFVARVSVWDELMALGEGLFQAAENGPAELRHALCKDAPYFRGPLPMKVFVFERMINVVLWRLQLEATLGMNIGRWAQIKKITPELMARYLTLDALKSQYLSTGQEPYLQQYQAQRTQLLQLQLSMA